MRQTRHDPDLPWLDQAIIRAELARNRYTATDVAAEAGLSSGTISEFLAERRTLGRVATEKLHGALRAMGIPTCADDLKVQGVER